MTPAGSPSRQPEMAVAAPRRGTGGEETSLPAATHRWKDSATLRLQPCPASPGASAALQSLCVRVKRFEQSQLISVLDGDSAAVAIAGGQVVLNLIPVVNGVLNSVSGRLSALTGGAIALPPVKTIPAAVCHALAG